MPVGLTLGEYLELSIALSSGSDETFLQAVQMEHDEMFPMTTLVASDHLRSRDYDCRPSMLDLLIQNGVVKLSKSEPWTPADVNAVA